VGHSSHINDSGVYSIAFDGDVQIQDVIAAVRGVQAEPTFRSEVLWDFRTASLAQLERPDLDQLISAFENRGSTAHTPDAAILVAHDVDYGVARILEALSKELPLMISVFRDFDTAMLWLATPSFD
jgi:hypothetical protein